MRHLVTGAGGFIAGHLIRSLLDDGEEVRGVDIKPREDWWQWHHDAQNFTSRDLMVPSHASAVMSNVDRVWHLACPMGGIGWISAERYGCARSAKMTTNMLDAAIAAGVDRFLLTSSACVYPIDQQAQLDVPALAEHMAWPARPEEGYGLSKLFEEKLCEYATADAGLATRIARYHNIYGPQGSWDGGKEKAPAAIARKVAEAVADGSMSIDIWGDGKQQRSFCWVGDCVRATRALMDSTFPLPLNIGSAEMVSIDELVTIAEEIAGVTLQRTYTLDAPTGVRGRNSDNTIFRDLFGWEPDTPLRSGMALVVAWVTDQVLQRLPRSGLTSPS